MDMHIRVDQSARTLTIAYGGIGMTKDDLTNELGSLGSCGRKKFLESIQEGADMNMTGQSGLGFYSVFLVADYVKVATKHDHSDVQWIWESAADGTCALYEDPRGNTLGRGTEITLELKNDADEYLDPEKLQEIVKQYSEFIHFPIYVLTTKTEKIPIHEPDNDKDVEDENVAGGGRVIGTGAENLNMPAARGAGSRAVLPAGAAGCAGRGAGPPASAAGKARIRWCPFGLEGLDEGCWIPA